MRLSTEAGWNQREEDWHAALDMTPGASFGATAEGVLVGTCIGISYGTFSWIAMMLVDSAFQRQGLGARLLLGTIKALPADQPVGLDATAVGRLVYEQHGFRDTCKLTRWVVEGTRFEELEGDAGQWDNAATIRAIHSRDLPAIASVDRQVFGGDRRRVLERALTVGPECCAMAMVDGELAGYVFGRHGRVFRHLGTVVARSKRVAQAVVRHVGNSAPRPLGIDAFDAQTGWTEWLRASGFVPQRPLARMMRVPAGAGLQDYRVSESANARPGNAPPDEWRAFSIFGPEFA